MMTKSIFKGIKHEKGEYLRFVDLLKAGIEMRVLPWITLVLFSLYSLIKSKVQTPKKKKKRERNSKFSSCCSNCEQIPSKAYLPAMVWT